MQKRAAHGIHAFVALVCAFVRYRLCPISGALVRLRESLIIRAIERQHFELYMNVGPRALLTKYSQRLFCTQMCTARRSSLPSIPYCGAFVRFRFYRLLRSRTVLP